MNAWKALGENMVGHWGEYAATLGVLGVAVVSCIPERVPKSLQEWWTWMRESLQTAIPAARHPVFPPGPATETSTEGKKEHE